jgi:predicted ArsR family transcriptional regulator
MGIEMDYSWIDTLVITEEASKTNGRPSTIFYIREKPFRFGYSYQSTASTQKAAEQVINQLKKDRDNAGTF